MATVKVTRNGQVTIPAQLRREMDIKEGDYVEVEIKGGEIVLKPKEMVDSKKKRAWDQLNELVEDVHAKNEGREPEEVQEEIVKAIHDVRGRSKDPDG